MMAKIVVNGYNDETTAPIKFTTLVGYRDSLEAITETDDITTEALLT